MSSADDWRRIHQKSELAYQQRSNWRFSANWHKIVAAAFEYAGVGLTDFAGKIVIDIGAGPRSFCEELEGCNAFLVEPLAKSYMKFNHEVYQISQVRKVFALPAEKTISQLENQADLVWCWNVLDHCFSWRVALLNILKYLKLGGVAIIFTDIGKKPEIGHPGIQSLDLVVRCLAANNLTFFSVAQNRDSRWKFSHMLKVVK